MHMSDKDLSIYLFKAAWPLRQRCFRIQAGLNNRWQFPCDLSCDLLGTAQANKAYRAGLNETLRRMMTGRKMGGKCNVRILSRHRS